MEDSWLENVLSLISVELKDGHTDTIDNLSDEMREDYLLSVKKAIGKGSSSPVIFLCDYTRFIHSVCRHIELPVNYKAALFWT